MNDHLTSEDRLTRLESHPILDWFEGWYLRWKHHSAQSEAKYHKANMGYHHDLSMAYLERAQFWRNRQIERGKDISYNPDDLTCWLNWLIGIGAVVWLAIIVFVLMMAWGTK